MRLFHGDRRWTSVRTHLVLAFLALSGCATEPAPDRPNVVIITVDTLRADRMPFNGCPQNTAPFLDELARRSLVFENAWSPSSWTLPAAVSVLTSVHPFQHGVTNLIGLELGPDEEPVPVTRIPDEVETLAETLGTAGYRTYGIVSNIILGNEIGFERGFDRFAQLPDVDADAVNAVAASWRAEILQDSPFFLYLHYFDPHDKLHARDPWFDLERSAAETGWSEEYSEEAVDPGQIDWFMTRLDPIPGGFEGKEAQEFSQSELRSFLAWCKAAYDSEIGFVDSRIREAFEMFEMEDAIVVFLADHGEEFYEHSHLTHGQNLYWETMRVPFFLYVPEGEAGGGRVEAHVSTLDVVPTLRRLLQLPDSDQDRGQDLLADTTRQPVFGILEGKSGQHDLDADLRSIILGSYRLIVKDGGEVELYDLEKDPLERTNVADELPEVVADLIGELDQIDRSAPRYPRTTWLPPPPNEALLEHLRGIGYLGK